MKKIIALLLCGALAGSMLTGCGQNRQEVCGTEQMRESEECEREERAEVKFTDDFGREVTVSNPQRVITLTGSFSDIWYLAGGIEQLVATTNATWTYFDLPLREDTVNLGSSKQLNLEQIIACEPDLRKTIGRKWSIVQLKRCKALIT